MPMQQLLILYVVLSVYSTTLVMCIAATTRNKGCISGQIDLPHHHEDIATSPSSAMAEGIGCHAMTGMLNQATPLPRSTSLSGRL